MFLRDPILELQLAQFRQRELREAAARERLVRSSGRPGDTLVRHLLMSLGDLLIGIGEKLRTEFDDPASGAAA